MTISKRSPERPRQSLRDEIISKGGSSVSDNKKENCWKTICLRMSESMLRRVEESVSEREGLTRNAWILEAISEKLQKMTLN